MSQYQIILSPRSKADLADIYAYTLQSWRKVQADTYLEKIEQSFNQLLDNPQIGRERSDIKEGYRCLNIEKHVLFYKLSKNEIHILGVLHSRMDIVNRLF